MANSDPTKVLILVGPIVYGGVETWVYSLLKTINRARFEPVICSVVYKDCEHSPRLYNLYRSTNVEIHEIRGRSVYDPRLILDIAKVIRQTTADIVHANYVTWGVFAGLICGVPSISHFHRAYSTMHRPFISHILYNLGQYFFTVNQANKKEIVRLAGVSPQKVKVIYCGVDLDRFKPVGEVKQAQLRVALKLDKEVRVVTTVCRLHPDKGLTYFLEMASLIKKRYQGRVMFLIVGDGMMRNELVRYTIQLNLENDVVFTGETDDVPSYLSISDVVVISSLYEGGPITLLEAFAMQKPVVSTPVGRVPEVVKDGETGFLVPVANSEAMAEKVLCLLKNPEIAEAFSNRAHELSPSLDNKVEVFKLENCYEEIIFNQTKRKHI